MIEPFEERSGSINVFHGLLVGIVGVIAAGFNHPVKRIKRVIDQDIQVNRLGERKTCSGIIIIPNLYSAPFSFAEQDLLATITATQKIDEVQLAEKKGRES